MKLSQISQWMIDMEKENPDIVTVVEYGQTYEKRAISLLRVSQYVG